MKNSPPGWPRISSSLFYKDAPAAIDWLVRAFGFEVRIKVESEPGQIAHSELVYGGGVVMVGSIGENSHKPGELWKKSPRELGGANTQAIMVYVDDVDAHCASARAAGVTIVVEPKTSDYGEGYWIDRSYQAEDLEGHHWWFVQRLSTSEKPA